MTTMTMPGRARNSFTAGRLPRGSAWMILAASWAVFAAVFAMLALSGATDGFNIVGAVFFGTILFDLTLFGLSFVVEGSRKARDRLMTSLVATAFIIALLPLISLSYTVLERGLARFDVVYFTESMRNVIDSGGGALHAIVGTLEITAMATLISVPVGLLASIYLVEYGRGHLARGITFFVDVMMGIPSIVAGLFTYALFVMLTGDPGIRSGLMGSVALSVLMIPVVVRSSEEILRLVPNELREASLALGVPKWLTVLKIVLPTSLAGLTTGVMLAIARVIGETAPLLIVAGFTASMNYNLFSDRMMSLPVFVYTQYANQGPDAVAFLDRAWSGALVLIIIVMLLNLIARIVARVFAPKFSR
ncbi:MAG: phosphate ABC transporter permease PstA [Microbacteriaceae bacterium]